MRNKFFRFGFSLFIVLACITLCAEKTKTDKYEEYEELEELEGTGESWYRACLWPNISSPSIFTTPDVRGISFGLATFGDEGETVGLDIGLGASTEYVHGAKIAFVTKGRYTKGFAGGIFNIDKEVDGVQFALCNEVEELTWGCQIGLVNEAQYSNGYQFGLINLMKNGYFEFMPFFNFPKDENTETESDEEKE